MRRDTNTYYQHYYLILIVIDFIKGMSFYEIFFIYTPIKINMSSMIQKQETLHNVLQKLTRIPPNFEMVMLEVGQKCDSEHDLALLELAVKYCQQKDSLEELLDDSGKIKIKEQLNFLHYILESPDGKDTKISNTRQ